VQFWSQKQLSKIPNVWKIDIDLLNAVKIDKILNEKENIYSIVSVNFGSL
jgi:hypothetical protein